MENLFAGNRYRYFMCFGFSSGIRHFCKLPNFHYWAFASSGYNSDSFAWMGRMYITILRSDIQIWILNVRSIISYSSFAFSGRGDWLLFVSY